MPRFLLESYVAHSPAALAEARERARRTADMEADVRYLRTTFLPGDETLLHVFEAPSAEALRHATGLARLDYERIVEAVEDHTKEDT